MNMDSNTFNVNPVQETTEGFVDISSPLSQTAHIQPESHSQKEPSHGEPTSKYLSYRKLVGNVSDHLRKENAMRLAYMYDLPAWFYEVGPTYDTAFTLRVLIALEGKGVYSPDNLIGLKEALKAINREDCARRVDNYLRSESDVELKIGSRRKAVSHSISMIISGDDVERDLVEPTLHQSRSIPNDIHVPLPKELGAHSTSESAAVAQLREAEPLSMKPRRSVSHLEFRLAIECVIGTAESLVSQISKISHKTRPSSPAPDSPLASTSTRHVPIYLQQAITCARQVASNLKQVVSDDGTNTQAPSSYHSAPVTPGRASPVPELDRVPSFSDPRKLSHSGSTGGRRLSKRSSISSGVVSPLETEHRLQQVRRELSFTDHEKKGDATLVTKENSSLPSKSTPNDILSAPQPEKMHGHSASQASSTVNSHVPVRRTRSRREVKQFSRKGLLFWQVKVKKLRLWLTQSSSKIESEQFYDHNKRSFKAILYPHGLSSDEGKYMTLTIDCLDEPKSKVAVPRSNIVVKLLDPQSTETNVPTVTRLIERRGIRFIQEFISHARVQELSSAGIIIITIAVVSEHIDDTDEDLL